MIQAEVLYGIFIPFAGTFLGSACVFFLRNTMSDRVGRALTGFAAGVMVAASIWSLLIPAMEESSSMGKWSFLPAVAGVWAGILFLLLLDHVIPHLHRNSDKAEGPKSDLSKSTMLMLAVTLHNIPEGMAVGVVYAGYLAGNMEISAMGALTLSLGIAIQNFPEGAVISMPLRATGMKKSRAFVCGALSGIVEPAGSVSDDPGRGTCHPRAAVSAEFCRRSHAVRGGGGADSRDVSGRAFQCGHRIFRRGIQSDDGSGRRVGMRNDKEGAPVSERAEEPRWEGTP